MSLSRLQMEMIVLSDWESAAGNQLSRAFLISPVVRGFVAEGCARCQFKAGDLASIFIESRDERLLDSVFDVRQPYHELGGIRTEQQRYSEADVATEFLVH
jgi:hypothetical protein